MKTNLERRGSLAIGGAAILWGLWGIVIHLAGLGGAQAACIALFSIGIFSLPLLPRRIPRGFSLWWPLLATGVTDAANALLYFEALQRGPVPIAVLAHYLAPVLVALGSPLMLGQRPSTRVLVALPVALVGLGLLLGDEVLHLGAGAITGALGAASALFYAGQVLIQKRVGDRLTPAELLVWHAFVGGLLLLPFALSGPPLVLGPTLLVAGGALIGGVVGGTAFLWGLKHVNAAKAGVLTYLEPAVGVAAGAILLGHPVPALAPVGGVLILAAGLWVLTNPKK